MESMKFGGHLLLHKLTSPQVQQRAAAFAKLIHSYMILVFIISIKLIQNK